MRDYMLPLIAVIGPVAFAVITSVTFAGVNTAQPVSLVVAGQGSQETLSLLRQLKAYPGIGKIAVIRGVPSAAQARAELASGSADGGIIFPAGFTAQLAGPRMPGSTVTILESSRKPIAGAVAGVLLESVFDQDAVAHAVTAVLAGRGPRPDPAGQEGADPAVLADVPASARTAGAASYYGPSMAVAFLLFTVIGVAKTLWTERASNCLRRLLSVGTSRGSIVLGKAAAAQLIGMASIGIVWATTVLLFKVTWGSPGAVAALAAATVAALVALSFAIAAIARSENQMDGITGAFTFVLVLVGGNFVPPSAMPGLMRHATLLTPNGWALRGFLDLATTQGGIAMIWEPLVVLLSIAAGLWLITASQLRQLMSP